VVEDEDLNETVYKLARSIADNAPLSTRAMKLAVNGVLQNESDRDMEAINAAVLGCFDSADYREGRTAFMEKRKPKWVGR
jgi:enoyl-CoA hydratase/carnithine racemase